MGDENANQEPGIRMLSQKDVVSTQILPVERGLSNQLIVSMGVSSHFDTPFFRFADVHSQVIRSFPQRELGTTGDIQILVFGVTLLQTASAR
jgi:hypothetical protein